MGCISFGASFGYKSPYHSARIASCHNPGCSSSNQYGSYPLKEALSGVLSLDGFSPCTSTVSH
jgi:hypothetical protein